MASATAGNWYAWKGYNDGKAVNLSGVFHTEADVYGFHGYATQAEAEANPNTVASWDIVERAQVDGWVNNAASSGAESTGGPTVSEVPGGKLVADVGSDTASVASFLGDLTNANTWIRLGKILVGGVLIIVAVSKMTGASNVVTEVAGKVPVL